jgi:hypothetical protein
MGLMMFDFIKKYSIYAVIGALLAYSKLSITDFTYWLWFIPILILIDVRCSVIIKDIKNENI